MKLKNKKTGEIGYPYFQNWKEISCVIVDENRIQIAEYTSLAELNAEWEDYEEPNGYYYVTTTGSIKYDDTPFCGIHKNRKFIGNYFETKEEAEKAVERLRAWKRLKDKGYRFSKWFTRVEGGIQINMEYNKYDGIDSECRNDLDLLFGGEE